MEGGEERFLKWATDLGITDSPATSPSPSSSLASSSSASSSSSSWCLSQSLRLSHFPLAGGRGLAAVRDLKRGELILRVPKCALMTSESVIKEDQALSLAVSAHPSLSSTQILIVCLLNEVSKGKNSRWYPYLTQLPRSYDILASFGPLEIQSFQVNDAIWAAERATEKAEADWKQAIALMVELHLKRHLRTLKAWLWAFGTISSRSLHIPWDDAGCLCPVGDLFNYSPPGEEANSEYSSNWRTQNSDITDQCNVEHSNENLLRLTDGGYDEDTSAYCFYARRNYNKGEQVLLSYGTYSNLELLEHYGFLLDTNPNEKAFIPLEPEIYSSCSWPKDSLFIHQNGIPSFALLSTLRLWLTPPSDRRSVARLIYSGLQLSSKNEMIVMRWIMKNCRVVLENVPTSIEEDNLLVLTINKMQDLGTLHHLESAMSSFEGEARVFLESKGLVNKETKLLLETKQQIRRCLDQWRLAVQWRLQYKRTVADCIKYCAQVLNEVLNKNDL